MKIRKGFTRYLFLFVLLIACNACKKDPPAVVDPTVKTFDLSNSNSWKFASTPLRFQESMLTNDISYGNNRAKFCWYRIDPLFYEVNSLRTPANITKADISTDDCRPVSEHEVFPSKEVATGQPMYLFTLNLDFYPDERGPWNYDTDPSAYSAGINYDGKLNNPLSRWGGMQRLVYTPSFKCNYLDFWLLDPFTTSPDASGDLYFDLGDISEDVLKDGLLSAENTIDGDVTETAWGKVWPLSGVNSFNSNLPVETDNGLDELNNPDEGIYFQNYKEKLSSICSAEAFQEIANDPTGDDYHYFLGRDYDELNYKVRQRHKNYNGDDHNSTGGIENYPTISTTIPDGEDLNRDGILTTENNYFEYKISVSRDRFTIGTNYIVDAIESHDIVLPDGSTGGSKFYHFRIPLNNFTSQFGMPSLAENPKSMRVYLSGFATPVNLRFMTLQLTEAIVDTKK
jgi:cell surface protein SprA